MMPGLSTTFTYDKDAFILWEATLPGGTDSDLAGALKPFVQQPDSLNVTIIGNRYTLRDSFAAHHNEYIPGDIPRNNSAGGQLIPRSLIQNNGKQVISIFRQMREDDTVPASQSGSGFNNFTHANIGLRPGTNSLLPAWRDSLHLNHGDAFPETASNRNWSFIERIPTWQIC